MLPSPASSFPRLTLAALAVLLLTHCASPKPEDFRRAELSTGGGPCTPEMDCSGNDELLADGTYRVDRFGEPDGGVHEATLSAADLDTAREVLTRPALLDALRRGQAACPPVTDSSAVLTVELAQGTYSSQVAGCQEQSVQDALQLFRRLRDTYAP